MRRSSWIGLILVSALLAAIGLGAGGAADAAPVPFTAGGSVNQVYVLDSTPGSTAELLDPTDAVIATATVDAQGGALFRDASVDVYDSGVRIPAGPGYRVRVGAEVSDPVAVLDPDVAPDQSFYDGQTIGEGFGYLETRDGTLLSINVSIPPGPGPHPTVIEYSGYSPSNPASPSQVLTPLQVQGYATVSVNMRGTGCSGGAFWYWEPLQALDGYDVVEAIGAQPWSANIGMAGISYSGISQLYVASTQPPSLDAITPLSVIADTYRSTLYPGGILNDGFALDWAIDRVEDAQPYALGWVNDQIATGDTVCDANQQLRLQSMDILSEITHVRYWEDRATVLAPWSFIDQIEVPTYLVGAWQDEQTGPHFATMLDRFDPATKTRFLLTNGTHMEGLGPSYIGHLLEWLDFYVAEKIPEISPLARAFAPALFADILGKGTDLPPDRFTGYPDYGSALAAFEAEQPVWIAWENGAGDVDPGYPVPTAVTTHDAWPLPEANATRFWLGPDGHLDDVAPTLAADEPRGVSDYLYDPTSQPDANYCCGSSAIWKMQPAYDWQPLPDGFGATFLTDPLTEPFSLAGSGSVELWLLAAQADVDLEVNLSEVRPDGQEMYIQSGWLRARQRAEDASRSTELAPWHTHTAADASPVPSDDFVAARVELMPFAHVVRPGSRLRLTIEAPGGNRALWEFDAETYADPVEVDIVHNAVMPSAVVLPVVDDPPVPAQLPTCPYSIRNQPCRAYIAPAVPFDVRASTVADGSGLTVRWDAPPADEAVLGYRISVIPGGETIDVDPDVVELVHPLGLGEQAAFEVSALFASGYGPASSPSALARVSVLPPTTTTTVAPSTTTTTAVPSPTATSTASTPTTAAAPTSVPTTPGGAVVLPKTVVAPTSGALPVTGSWSVTMVMLAAPLLLAGVLILAVRRRTSSPGD